MILDQTDLLFTLERVEGDPEAPTRRKLWTVGCRIDEEPEPRWLAIKPGLNLRVRVEQAEPCEGDGPGRPKERTNCTGRCWRCSTRRRAPAAVSPKPSVRTTTARFAGCWTTWQRTVWPSSRTATGG